MHIVIATTKSWNIENAIKFKEKYISSHQVYIVTKKEDLNDEYLSKINPSYIFFPHWSWIISKDIYTKYSCIVFHMTDLPFGRGGSPLQNLIDMNIENTKISALKVDSGVDTGDIYLKKELNLNGTAEEIFMRASNIIFKEMIPYILNNKLKPQKQNGNITTFKRRTYDDGEIKQEFDLKKIFDYIRMLDAEDYPPAYIKFGEHILQFSRASLKNGKVVADVTISYGGKNE